MVARWILLAIFISYCDQCHAGFFSNLRGFFTDRFRRKSFLSDREAVECYSPVDLREPLSTDEIVQNLTVGNEVLRLQVSSLKTTVNTQKKQLSEVKKEKEALRKVLSFELKQLEEQQESDRESIKNELRNVFEEEKIVMIASFEDEKDLLKEEFLIEIKDIKQELEQKAAEIDAKRLLEIEYYVETNVRQSKKIEEYEISEVETTKVINTHIFVFCFCDLYSTAPVGNNSIPRAHFFN